ncbi:MAG TPA: efflux RND transporter periplasmic adaptor subunit [Vicinamibacterales bacterium]|nr:efflux RND transporter periplasmic adaptor subunit [Vicinamibacterales bacterium]HOQ60252.1 efflux RND transporter periplasmic adaptor subunit [Vicinamibacterales bacterium]HPK70356.1 efflux RND transporter periplasmic adaptor subunit [Vicinamibacterales bacterium]
MTIERTALALLAALALAASGACGGNSRSRPEAGDHDAGPHEDASAGRNIVHVAPDLQRKWGIGVAEAGRAALPGTITVPGVLALDPQRSGQVSSPLDGKVASVGAQVGDEVRRGQALVTVHAPALAQAKTAYLQAAARLALTRRESERADVLLEREAIDQQEHLRRRTAYENASSEFAAAESSLHSYGLDQAAVERLLQQARRPDAAGAALDGIAEPYLRLASPTSGRVIERDVVVGQHVEPRQTLLVVADLSTLWALLDAREADLPLVARGQAVRITAGVYPGRAWSGRVDHVGDVVDEKTRTVKVRVVVRNDERLLKPNMFVQGEFPTAAVRDALTVPLDAVQTIGGEPVVFVREGAGRFAARPVEIGGRAGDRRIVLKGLDEGEAVVVAGAFTLKAELLKSTLAGE